jgi:hypothetical protein
MIETARTQPNARTLQRIIQVVKSVFGEGKAPEADTKQKKKKDEIEVDEADKPKQPKKVLSQMLGQEEYRLLFQFFTTELPTLAL